jgi:hypothetical protein
VLVCLVELIALAVAACREKLMTTTTDISMAEAAHVHDDSQLHTLCIGAALLGSLICTCV